MKESLPLVRDRIGEALARAARQDEVGIVAVTKGHPVSAVQAALSSGLHRLGENRVSELEEKVCAVGRDAAEWHLIGHLQRNKARTAVTLFDRIHSIDSVRLARKLSAESERGEREVVGYVQVNVSDESAKGGFGPDAAVEAIGEIAALPGLRLQGLMTMAPWTDDESVLRSTFRDTRSLLERARAAGLAIGAGLSMGMSNDFEIAIEEGSTMVRLGTVLFGERER